MKNRWVGYPLVWTCLLLSAEPSAAQTAVQLPTIQQFGVTTTIVVPDGGTAYLGGVNRSSRGSSSFGAGLPGLGNRGFGRTSSAGGVSVSTMIIDHREIDRALLAEAARRRGAKHDVLGQSVKNTPQPRSTTLGTRAPASRFQRSYLPKNLLQNIRGGAIYR